jgi:arabinan endo-1,5-alpha-L-arabinosidase
MKKKLLFLVILFIAMNWGHSQNVQKNIYKNPVLAMNFPDPAIIREKDGTFYAFATQGIGINGKSVHIQEARSKDLVHWKYIGDALPKVPEWGKVKKEYWAPSIIFDQKKNKYFMYYAVEGNAGGKCIGIAIANHAKGPYKDIGKPLICGEGFVNIDPMAFDDPQTGKKLLYWGSGFGAIKVQELDDSRTNFRLGSKPINLVNINFDKDYDKLVEGAWVIYHNGYYYLFYSGDNCCGIGTHYAVMVARSKNALGPFQHMSEVLKKHSSVILHMSNRWIGPGHNCIVQDDAGNDWILYHAIKPENKARIFRELLLDKINWINGWPEISNSIPSDYPTSIPKISK